MGGWPHNGISLAVQPNPTVSSQ